MKQALRALANERRLQILEWLRDPEAHFPPQVEGDLVRDGVCGVLIARKLRVNPDWFLVGEVEGTIVGTCMVGYEGHRGWINLLAVAPAHRRGGKGRALMAEAERILRAAGCAKINLQVRATNRQVLAFYKKLGFATENLVHLGKRLARE